MNAGAVSRLYGSLTPEERFRLILAASGRGDEVERIRLVSAAPRITLAMPDHSPFAQAFRELAFLIFIELLAEAGRYTEALALADASTQEEPEEEERGEGEEAAEPANEGTGKRSLSERFLDLAWAAGFMLRTKADGWKLFCERLNVPPFLLWGGLPGLDRLQRALSLAENAAFVPEGFLRWLNRTRPKGAPERADVPLTVEGTADATECLFRERAAWWNGDARADPDLARRWD